MALASAVFQIALAGSRGGDGGKGPYWGPTRREACKGGWDVLTFQQNTDIRIVKILACGTRRGPAPEAQALYEDMSPPKVHVPKNPGFEGKGRPTKKDRRDMLYLRAGDGSFTLE
jgi:hypothetical protein